MNAVVGCILFLLFLATFICEWVCATKSIRRLSLLLASEGPEEIPMQVCERCGALCDSNLSNCPYCNNQMIQVLESKPEPEQEPEPVIQVQEQVEAEKEPNE